ncbi:MAG: deoxyribodipyrimidine photo-lyase [Chloroflexi bacterium]|nr:deoxyribodipyrimidine photo-lyase [Chloroflexota bacterium]
MVPPGSAPARSPGVARRGRARGARLPAVVFDEPLLGGRWPSPNRISFMRASAMELDGSLRAVGSRLHVRRGRPAQVVAAFAREVGADAVIVSRDYGPYARSRDSEVAAALAAEGRSLHARRGLLVQEPEDVLTQGGERFSVYSPFRRAFERLERRRPRPAPLHIPTPKDAVVGGVAVPGQPHAGESRPGSHRGRRGRRA